MVAQVETEDDGEALLLTGYAAPMGQSDLDIAHLGMYHDPREQTESGPNGKQTKFYTFIHRPRSSRPVLPAARRSRSAEPVPPAGSASVPDSQRHTRHFSLDDEPDDQPNDSHHDHTPRSKSRTQPSKRSPSRPLSASTAATNSTVTDHDHRKKLRRHRRPEGITISPPAHMPDVLDLTSPVASPVRGPSNPRPTPHPGETRERSRAKSPNPFARLFHGLSSPRKASTQLPSSHSRSGSPTPRSRPQSPSIGVSSVPGSPRKERGRSQTCWRFFSGAAPGAASTSAGKRAAESGSGMPSEKVDGLHAHAPKRDKESGSPEKKAGVTVVAPRPLPARAIPAHMNGAGYQGVPPVRVRTSPPRLDGGNAGERESIGTEKLGRCSPLLLSFGHKGKSKERKEKETAKVEIRVVGEPIIARDYGKDRHAARPAGAIGRPYASGSHPGASTAKVHRSSTGSGSKSGKADAKAAKRLKHGSFDFERPASGGSSLEGRTKSLKDKERALEGHRGARVVDASLTANTRKHPQRIQFKSLSETEDNGLPSPLRRRGTGGSAASRAHGYSHSQTTVSASGDSAEGREAGGSWGRSHHPPRSALQQRHRHLGAFQFEPAVPYVPPSAPRDGMFASRTTGAPLANKTPKVNLVPASPFLDDSSSHSAPSTKAKSLDLGLGLAWAPSRVKEDHFLPNSHGIGLMRSKEREQVLTELRALVGDAGMQRVEKYIRRCEAGQLPLDGPSGLASRVRKVVELSPSPMHGFKSDERSRRLLIDRLVRAVQAGPVVAT
ncbi:hypothetical protein GLOTRDRAFT_119367 [Gloeophyllum trabeum ATCC 11539]|uniref:Uncharacterized protein n=1 Tax=Gloeophyllum trabeum (strain ATCC 11539 / FP-39264 / Madison 617) TaxID=670483 RepID=S7QIJ4_GLOTA|nr:uncharacterized protein GLOTRDRAFT_119367 [Gloeophyllum trabeum ATCC 11539]EPQ59093.1 hypothetical protein GLOTRDRAFT_119367 [Gloeophyllum trabeum ATCC 11539]